MTSNTTNDKISNALDVYQDVEIEGEVIETLPATINPQKEDNEALLDSKLARENIHDLIRVGQNALDELAIVAEQSQHPRAYEVLATLTKTLLEANKDLVNVHKQRKELNQKEESPKRRSDVTNNNLFVGSTNELKKMLKNMREDEE